MTDARPLHVEREGTILVITLAHPPVNAINRAMLAGIGEALSAAADAGECRAVILTAAGSRCFSAGADLAEIGEHGETLRAGGLALTRAIERSPLPVIAAVNGAALGGGCELALAADIRIAATAARFAQPEITLGIIPGWGATQRLPRLVGRAAALRLLLEGEAIDAARALALGLVSQVVEADALAATARAVAGALAGRPPLAVAALKRAVHQGLDRPLEEGLAIEAAELAAIRTSEDAAEGVLAFLQKRPPRWRGR